MGSIVVELAIYPTMLCVLDGLRLTYKPNP